MSLDEAIAVLNDCGMTAAIFNSSDAEIIHQAERMLLDIQNWEEGYAKHKAEMKGDADEQDNQ